VGELDDGILFFAVGMGNVLTRLSAFELFVRVCKKSPNYLSGTLSVTATNCTTGSCSVLG
jgi:hypothetical protein